MDYGWPRPTLLAQCAFAEVVLTATGGVGRTTVVFADESLRSKQRGIFCFSGKFSFIFVRNYYILRCH
jgi:hypothetical protein